LHEAGSKSKKSFQMNALLIGFNNEFRYSAGYSMKQRGERY
jgi:hypothetical protein